MAVNKILLTYENFAEDISGIKGNFLLLVLYFIHVHSIRQN